MRLLVKTVKASMFTVSEGALLKRTLPSHGYTVSVELTASGVRSNFNFEVKNRYTIRFAQSRVNYVALNLRSITPALCRLLS